MRSRAGRGERGEVGEKRKWMFCFAECRAEEERMLARAEVEVSEVDDRSVVSSEEPLEGDIVLL